MSIELPNRDLVEQLHANIQDLKHRYPNRWQSMLEILASGKDVDLAQLARQHDPKPQQSYKVEFTSEQVKEIALRAIEGQ
ncbi:MAG: hypothetical protein J0L70_30745 [Leptolyngbya sp. UWPOB_LEPTO1]|uniref:hypothetical protein n=1 Tax=Leptolyngbya sp. UWPOB_LEPTO1 TaxID=2815653 RepID=UPI001AD3FE67|nr:hypothetical protein [Leptolyngbya sp. UWPOB_LEPTO1]MBN8564899.1 hypothetical protein [Leptolyngbya sp. UWPOB_LEPTO1]